MSYSPRYTRDVKEQKMLASVFDSRFVAFVVLGLMVLLGIFGLILLFAAGR